MAMNIQDEIMNTAAENLAKDIDFEVLVGMLESIGWHRVILPNLWRDNGAVNILNWCETNINHPFEHRGFSFVFENKGDAVNFALRWA
jgi:hypothetical protein